MCIKILKSTKFYVYKKKIVLSSKFMRYTSSLLEIR
jgi:hypothetical protein